MIEFIKLCRNGEPVKDILLHDISDELEVKDNGFFWISIDSLDPGSIQFLDEVLRLHEMLTEDILEGRQHSKIERYNDCVFFFLNVVRLDRGKLAFDRLRFVVVDNGLITFGIGNFLDPLSIQSKCDRYSRINRLDLSLIIYFLIDRAIDDLFEVISHVQAVFRDIEEHLISQRNLKEKQTFQLYLLRRDLLKIQGISLSMVELMKRFQFEDNQYIDIDRGYRPYFRDLYFNSAQANDEISNLLETIGYTYDVASIVADARENRIQKTLGSWAAIFAVPTIVGSIYGMNFEFMPELHWKYSYHLVIAASILLCASLYFRFRQIDWL